MLKKLSIILFFLFPCFIMGQNDVICSFKVSSIVTLKLLHKNNNLEITTLDSVAVTNVSIKYIHDKSNDFITFYLIDELQSLNKKTIFKDLKCTVEEVDLKSLMIVFECFYANKKKDKNLKSVFYQFATLNENTSSFMYFNHSDMRILVFHLEDCNFITKI